MPLLAGPPGRAVGLGAPPRPMGTPAKQSKEEAKKREKKKKVEEGRKSYANVARVPALPCHRDLGRYAPTRHARAEARARQGGRQGDRQRAGGLARGMGRSAGLTTPRAGPGYGLGRAGPATFLGLQAEHASSPATRRHSGSREKIVRLFQLVSSNSFLENDACYFVRITKVPTCNALQLVRGDGEHVSTAQTNNQGVEK